MNQPVSRPDASRPGAHRQGRWANRGVWASGLLVAVGAAVTTAHGLYAVVVATGTLPLIAALYPLITDGLALVAYAATARLTGSGRRYASCIVVLAAGLSGLAQATHVAGGLAKAAVPDWLRFGVGAWPALAAAIVAHLLYLLGHARMARHSTTTASTAGAEAGRPTHPHPSASISPSSSAVHSGVQLGQVNGGADGRMDLPGVEQIPGQTSISVGGRSQAQPNPTRPPVQVAADGRDSAGRAGTPRDRARAAALLHQQRTGDLPTVSTLMDLAGVARGTAGNALRDIRDEAQQETSRDHRNLHVVNAASTNAIRTTSSREASSDRSGQQ